jgi:hypothetical protein
MGEKCKSCLIDYDRMSAILTEVQTAIELGQGGPEKINKLEIPKVLARDLVDTGCIKEETSKSFIELLDKAMSTRDLLYRIFYLSKAEDITTEMLIQIAETCQGEFNSERAKEILGKSIGV